MPEHDDNPQRFAQAVASHWTQAQPTVRSFLFSVVHEPAAVDDILQDVALTVVRRFDTFEPGTNFVAWAVTIARHKAMDFHKTRARDRHVLDDAVLDRLASAAVQIEPEIGPRRRALDVCMDKLPDRQRRMLAMRYEEDATPAQIAEAEGMKPGSVSVALHRVRLALRDCIEQQTSTGASGGGGDA